MGHQKNRTGVYSGTVRYYRVPGRTEVRERDIIYIAGARAGVQCMWKQTRQHIPPQDVVPGIMGGRRQVRGEVAGDLSSSSASWSLIIQRRGSHRALQRATNAAG